jgi:hypothetical protein
LGPAPPKSVPGDTKIQILVGDYII